jgi:hypothetical protein
VGSPAPMQNRSLDVTGTAHYLGVAVPYSAHGSARTLHISATGRDVQFATGG